MSRFSKDQRQEIYSVAFNVWGAHAQELMAVEEMSELTQALSKHFRGKTDLVNIVEEIADVRIMLEQLEMLFDCSAAVQGAMDYKIERLHERLDNSWRAE